MAVEIRCNIRKQQPEIVSINILHKNEKKIYLVIARTCSPAPTMERRLVLNNISTTMKAPIASKERMRDLKIHKISWACCHIHDDLHNHGYDTN